MSIAASVAWPRTYPYESQRMVRYLPKNRSEIHAPSTVMAYAAATKS